MQNFSVLPPEINSGLVFAGTGPGPMLAAATAWDGLAAELYSAAGSFESVTSGLAGASWQGPASMAMTAAAGPYVAWLSTSAAHAAESASLARSAATEFEAALAATVHPAAVAATRTEVMSLLASNVFGQNAPAIAAVESLYEQMWAQDVAAMAGYYAGASALVEQLSPWQSVGTLSNGAPGAAASATAFANSGAAATVAYIAGGSGTPIPSAWYVQLVRDLYVQRIAPLAIAQALFTPQGLYPVIAIKNLTFDASVAQGVAILDSAIRQQLAAGNNVTVFGYSQSATIASLEMAKLAASANPPPPDQLSFTLIGNPNNPNGGLATRFPGLSLPSIGVSASGATPHNLYPTNIYTIEYDGVADFPRYPLNVVSTLNAIAGAYYVHTGYFYLTPGQIDAAIPLTNTVGPTMTHYYVIPTENLPLLEPLRGIPIIGDPLANLVQPNLKVIVNLGYGDPAHGYSTSPPNVATPFGLFPEVHPVTVVDALAAGTHQGISAFAYDIGHLDWPPPPDLLSLLPASSGTGSGGSVDAGPGPGIPAITIDTLIDGFQAANTKTANAITNVVATSYTTLLPTADIATAILTTAPPYNVNLFLEGIRQAAHGDPMGLVNAIGYPIAADVALLTVAGALEMLILINAAQDIAGYV